MTVNKPPPSRATLAVIDGKLSSPRQPLAPTTERAVQPVYQHSLLCQIPMPYKAPASTERKYHHQHGQYHLWIKAGEAVDEEGREVEFPLPYGPLARLFFIHLNSEIKRQDHANRLSATTEGLIQLEVAPSMTAFARQMGVRLTGPGLRQFKKTIASVCASTWTFAKAVDKPGYTGGHLPIIQYFDLWFPKDENQRILWESCLLLNPQYVQSVIQHAVPLSREAIYELRASALALDIYSWLAHRLQRPDVQKSGSRGLFLTWDALKRQFGPNVSRMSNFRADFLRALRAVHDAYPQARFRIESNRNGKPAGLRLLPSPPAVPHASLALASSL